MDAEGEDYFNFYLFGCAILRLCARYAAKIIPL